MSGARPVGELEHRRLERRSWAPRIVALLFSCGLASPGFAAGEAGGPHHARIGARLERALQEPLPEGGIAIRVSLLDDDLPTNAGRAAQVAARQQRVLGGLAPTAFRLTRRYAFISGFAAQVQPPVIEALRRHPEVTSIHLDGELYATLGEGRVLVGATTAHSLGFTGAGVNVAVLDTGIDTDHPDLADDLVAEQCFCDTHPSPVLGACCPGGGSTQSGPGSAEDDAGHGTAVSGIITSVFGIAPDSGIVAIKVLNANGLGSDSSTDAALDWVLMNHATYSIRVVNMSIGDGGEYNDPTVSTCQGNPTANAIRDLALVGVATFAGSGNDGHDDGISFPACSPDAISVGGTYDAPLGSVSWCANSSCSSILCTDVASVDGFVCHTNSDEILDVLAPNWRTTTSKLGGGSTNFGGTSASSPYAAAQGALLLQADPTLTPAQIRSRMRSFGPMVTNPDNGLSFRRTDIAAAIQDLVAACGNSILEVGEDCDDGNLADGDCCSPSCQFESAGSTCRVAADVCDVGESCTGTSGVCPADGFEPATTECRAAIDLCDAPELCTGADVACPADALEPATTECRAAAGFCDVAELCDGLAPACPADAFEPATVGCRGAIASCDQQENCTGADALCPPDGFKPATAVCRAQLFACDLEELCTGTGPFCPADETLNLGDPCEDGDACTVGEECLAGGACGASEPIDCDDGNACTADSCDEVSGCDHAPIEPCVEVPTTSTSGQLFLIALLMAGGTLVAARRGRALV